MEGDVGKEMKRVMPVIGLCLLLFGCSKYYRNFELDERSFDRETLQLIEKAFGFPLSTNARGLNYYYKAPVDPSFVAKVEMPSSARSEILQRISAITNEDVHVAGAISERVQWWTPTRGKILIDRQRTSVEAYQHAILAEEGGCLILYLEWSL